MLIRRWLLVGFGGLAGVHATGVLFDAPILPTAEVLAWATLLGYLLISGTGAPRRAWIGLLGGVLAFGVVPLIGMVRRPDTGWVLPFAMANTPDSDWQTFTYEPLSSAAGPWQVVGPAVWPLALVLTGFGCLAYAVLATRWVGFATTRAAATRGGGRRWAATAGLVLVAVSATIALDDLVRPWLIRPPEDHSTNVLMAVAIAPQGDGAVPLEIAAMVDALARFVGTAMVVLALAALRPVDAERAAPPDPGS